MSHMSWFHGDEAWRIEGVTSLYSIVVKHSRTRCLTYTVRFTRLTEAVEAIYPAGFQ